MRLILHITPRHCWEEAQRRGVYQTDTLATQGFIHCSTPRQVIDVADHLFRGQTGLVLLCIASDKLSAELRYEALGTEESFPHLYGLLNLDAVQKVLDFSPGPGGRFALPEELHRR